MQSVPPNTAMKLARVDVSKEVVHLGAQPAPQAVQLSLAWRLATRAAYGRRRSAARSPTSSLHLQVFAPARRATVQLASRHVQSPR